MNVIVWFMAMAAVAVLAFAPYYLDAYGIGLMIGMLGYVWIWIGIAVIIATFSLGATGVGGGVPLATVFWTIFLANVGIGLFMLFTADIGTEHGLPFAVYLRAPFGIRGTHLPAISRGLVASMWFGIQTYLGALALNGIGSHFLGFDNWFVWYVLFGLVHCRIGRGVDDQVGGELA